MYCSRCLSRAYTAVLDVHGNPQPSLTTSAIISRRFIHSRKGRIRRPAVIFDTPPSTAVDKRGKLLTRGGEKSIQERRTTISRDRSAVSTVNDGDGRVNNFFKSSSRELQVDDRRKTDPAKIAFAVQKALNGTAKEHEEAIDLLRELTSRYGRKDLVVAWNHVIEWKLIKGNVIGALKVYNEMKKRGSKPDSYTYLRILNGLAENAAKTPIALGRALTIFHSMTAPSSPIKPSIMHTNAILKVCAQAKDVDAMWDIAERIPDRGKGQADSTTYTTLLNGIRNSIDESPDTAITEARELWENILLKWQEGSLMVDEGLGCAMARLLLKSRRPEDWDEVLSLFQDVFGIPRLIPRIGTKARTLLPIKDLVSGKTINKPTDQEFNAKDAEQQTMDLNESLNAAMKSAGGIKNDEDSFSSFEESSNAEEEAVSSTSLVDTVADRAGALVTSEIPAEKIPIGNNGLSVLMETCLSLRAYDTALNYWDLVTESYSVTPDRDNYHGRMRMLSMLNDSAGCLSLIEEMASNGILLNQNLFFIALNGCRRVKRITGFNDAIRILDLMKKYDVEFTSKCITAFIRTATVTEDVEVLRRAWEKLGPYLFNIHKMIDPTGKSVDKVGRDLEACQELVSLSDALLSKMHQHRLNKAEKEFAETVSNARKKIQKYLNEYFNQKKANSEEGTLIQKVKAHKRENEVVKEDHKRKVALQSPVGRWEKFETEELGPGEASLKGINFKSRAVNNVGDAVGAKKKPKRQQRFLKTKNHSLTAHYKPKTEKELRERAKTFE